MYRYLYLSDVSPEFEPYQMGMLAQRARAKNQRLNITGLLLFDGLHFCQYLEGAKGDVQQLMRVIERDPRHCNLRLLGEGLSTRPRRLSDEGLFVGYSTDAAFLPGLAEGMAGMDQVVAQIWEALPRLDVDQSADWNRPA
ncbi:hypothetical protein GCM10007860_01990 [Chitiniphilus shinanonensis]|uniref:BLUF domain-containing protein n=1 Tax=Chitiniphilus shinanonensis TaxID=553088 RepID=A0ABQ6BRA4_9NEIS|nr:BLUF domain-containing protein [Chitiniphilus shinanonensis]GLS03056.1 hypothetical protein GCM10007860_01990 [Chitiniphilus shinanonensis]